MLEKAKYELTKNDLEKKEEVLIKQKEFRALLRKNDEDKKIFSLNKPINFVVLQTLQTCFKRFLAGQNLILFNSIVIQHFC